MDDWARLDGSDHWMWDLRVAAVPPVPPSPKVAPAADETLRRRIRALAAAPSFEQFRAGLLLLLEEIAVSGIVENELETHHAECARVLARDVDLGPGWPGVDYYQTGGACALAKLATPLSEECDRNADAMAELAATSRRQSEAFLAQPTIAAEFVARLAPLRDKAEWTPEDQRLVREHVERDGLPAVRGVVGDHRQLLSVSARVCADVRVGDLFLIRVVATPPGGASGDYYVHHLMNVGYRGENPHVEDYYAICSGRSGAEAFTRAGAAWFVTRSGWPASVFQLVQIE